MRKRIAGYGLGAAILALLMWLVASEDPQPEPLPLEFKGYLSGRV